MAKNRELSSIEHGLDVKVHTLEEILPIRLNCKLTLVKLVIVIIFSGKLLNVLSFKLSVEILKVVTWD